MSKRIWGGSRETSTGDALKQQKEPLVRTKMVQWGGERREKGHTKVGTGLGTSAVLGRKSTGERFAYTARGTRLWTLCLRGLCLGGVVVLGGDDRLGDGVPVLEAGIVAVAVQHVAILFGVGLEVVRDVKVAVDAGGVAAVEPIIHKAWSVKRFSFFLACFLECMCLLALFFFPLANLSPLFPPWSFSPFVQLDLASHGTAVRRAPPAWHGVREDKIAQETNERIQMEKRRCVCV